MHAGRQDQKQKPTHTKTKSYQQQRYQHLRPQLNKKNTRKEEQEQRKT